MKEFVLGSAFLMFISSLPAGVSNGHTVRLEPELTPQKAAFLQSFGNSLPPIGYVTFCREHEAECSRQVRLSTACSSPRRSALSSSR